MPFTPHSTSGKLRHGSDPKAAFLQFIGRKLRNHDPMSLVDGTAAELRYGTMRVGVDEENSRVIYRTKSGRTYEIQVTEIDEVTNEDAAVINLTPIKA